MCYFSFYIENDRGNKKSLSAASRGSLRFCCNAPTLAIASDIINASARFIVKDRRHTNPAVSSV